LIPLEGPGGECCTGEKIPVSFEKYMECSNSRIVSVAKCIRFECVLNEDYVASSEGKNFNVKTWR
jgi:hypothetical protein